MFLGLAEGGQCTAAECEDADGNDNADSCP